MDTDTLIFYTALIIYAVYMAYCLNNYIKYRKRVEVQMEKEFPDFEPDNQLNYNPFTGLSTTSGEVFPYDVTVNYFKKEMEIAATDYDYYSNDEQEPNITIDLNDLD